MRIIYHILWFVTLFFPIFCLSGQSRLLTKSPGREHNSGEVTAMTRVCKIRIFFFLLPAVICVLCLLSACGGQAAADVQHAAVPSFPPLREKDGLRIAVASDLHFNPDDRPDPEAPRETAYSLELADALIWDVRQQDADLLILTGDLCNGGKPHRHEALTEKLRALEADGIAVYVLPGNHDLAPVTQTEFAALYTDFGYGEASSRDTVSLSYSVIRDGLMLLMLDTAGYPAVSADLPGASLPDSNRPYLSEQTLRWAEERLNEAKEKDLTVLAAGHYNVLTPSSRDDSYKGFYLESGERLASLLEEAGVPLYLSGHIHSRAVYQEKALTELVTEFLLGYPTAYSVLDLTEEDIVYTPRRIDVDAWAQESGQTDPVLLHFAQWQQDALRHYAHENVKYMSERNPLSAAETQQAEAFFYDVMNSYWQGSLSTDREKLETMPGYEPFFRCAEGYSYAWWLKDLISAASPLLKGFRIAR